MRKVMHHGTLIKTFQPPNLGFILHSRHQYHWHTGYVPPQPVNVPSIGGVLARTRGAAVKGVRRMWTSVNDSMSAAKTSRSRRFTRRDFSATITGRFSSRNRRTRSRRYDLRRACRGSGSEARMERFHKLQALRSTAPKAGEDYLKRLDAAYELMESPAAPRSTFRLSRRRLTTGTIPADSVSAACWRGAWSSRDRDSSK